LFVDCCLVPTLVYDKERIEKGEECKEEEEEMGGGFGASAEVKRKTILWFSPPSDTWHSGPKNLFFLKRSPGATCGRATIV